MPLALCLLLGGAGGQWHRWLLETLAGGRYSDQLPNVSDLTWVYFSVLYFLLALLDATFYFLCLNIQIHGLMYFGRSTRISLLLK